MRKPFIPRFGPLRLQAVGSFQCYQGNNIVAESSGESDNGCSRSLSIGRAGTGLFLTAFGDDSADATKQRVFSLACVVAREPAWKALVDAWKDRTEGIPFHATDCDSDQGDYKNKPHSENKALYKDLATILAQSGAHGFGVAVDLAGHREFFPGVPEELSYHFCLIRMIDFFAKLASDWAARELKISLDNRLDVRFNAATLYSLMVNDPSQPHREIMSDELSFLCSSKNPRIQIGDLYARECMKHLDNLLGPVKRPERKSMTALLETKRFGADLYMREYFEDKKKHWHELEQKSGMTQQMYMEWLAEHCLVDNVSNMFKFLDYLHIRDKNPENGKTQRAV